MPFDSGAAPARYTPTAPMEEGGSGRVRERERALRNTSHMKVTSVHPGEITGPDRKVTAGLGHQASC